MKNNFPKIRMRVSKQNKKKIQKDKELSGLVEAPEYHFPREENKEVEYDRRQQEGNKDREKSGLDYRMSLIRISSMTDQVQDR